MKARHLISVTAIAVTSWVLVPVSAQAEDREVNNALCWECADQDEDWRRYRNAAIQQCLSVPAEVPVHQVFGVDPSQIQQCRQMIAYNLVHGSSDRVIIDVCPSGDRVPADRLHLCVTIQIQIEWETATIGVNFVVFGYEIEFPVRPTGVTVYTRTPDGTTGESGYNIYFPDDVLTIPGGWPPTDPSLLPYPSDINDHDIDDNDEEEDDVGDDDGPSGDEEDPPGPPDHDEEQDDECWEC